MEPLCLFPMTSTVMNQEWVFKTSFLQMLTWLGYPCKPWLWLEDPLLEIASGPYRLLSPSLCLKQKYKYTSWLYSHVLWIVKWLVQPLWPSVCLLTALGRAEHSMNFSESWYIKSTPKECSSNDWELNRHEPFKTSLKIWEFVFFLLSFLLLIFLLSSE